MSIIGYHCSHEQFTPSELLRYSRMAQEADFGGAMCSDHFHPWSEQGQNGFAWLQGYIGLDFGRIFVFNATSDQSSFLTAYRQHVLPALC